jgi:hypothetical protein
MSAVFTKKEHRHIYLNELSKSLSVWSLIAVISYLCTIHLRNIFLAFLQCLCGLNNILLLTKVLCQFIEDKDTFSIIQYFWASILFSCEVIIKLFLLAVFIMIALLIGMMLIELVYNPIICMLILVITFIMFLGITYGHDFMFKSVELYCSIATDDCLRKDVGFGQVLETGVLTEMDIFAIMTLYILFVTIMCGIVFLIALLVYFCFHDIAERIKTSKTQISILKAKKEAEHQRKFHNLLPKRE